MRQVNIKALYAQLSKELKDLPFEVIKNKKIIAVVSRPIAKEIENNEVNEKNMAKSLDNSKYSKKPIKKQHPVITTKKQNSNKIEAALSVGVRPFFNPQPKKESK